MPEEKNELKPRKIFLNIERLFVIKLLKADVLVLLLKSVRRFMLVLKAFFMKGTLIYTGLKVWTGLWRIESDRGGKLLT